MSHLFIRHIGQYCACFLLCGLAASGVAAAQEPTHKSADEPSSQAAEEFIATTEAAIQQRSEELGPLFWLQNVFITEDTQKLARQASLRSQQENLAIARQAQIFEGVQLDAANARKLRQLRQAADSVHKDAAKARELTQLGQAMAQAWATATHCQADGPDQEEQCLGFQDLNNILNTSRDEKELRRAWLRWRETSKAHRDDYQRFAALANEAAQSNGYVDLGALWRGGYDMPAADFITEMQRSWEQVKPLFSALHCHVRASLNQHYGDAIVPLDQAIPAHLLGDMHAMSWLNIDDLAAPAEAGDDFDLTAAIVEQGLSEQDMARVAERFFISLGFEPLPETFWTRSVFKRPEDHQGLCYANAPNVDNYRDVRLNMCVQKTASDLRILHHEIGHDYYHLAYSGQSPLFRAGANDGFHEAVGDTMLLSITPGYLKAIGLMPEGAVAGHELAQLLRVAMERVALLPWTYLVDQWRWQVFAGDITAENYNSAWWRLREEYQGVRPPLARDETQFDAFSKFHIAANVPYARYYLAQLLQFQFHQALCQKAGHQGPLHQCSIYNNKEAGKAFQDMLAVGSSKPWQDVLEQLTGSRHLDGSALREYFRPLMNWLNEQNKNRQCGW